MSVLLSPSTRFLLNFAQSWAVESSADKHYTWICQGRNNREYLGAMVDLLGYYVRHWAINFLYLVRNKKNTP